MAYKILPSISDEDEKIKQEVKILIHLGDLETAEAVASNHSCVKPISDKSNLHLKRKAKINYVGIISRIIDKYLDLNNIDKANLLFKKIDENKDLSKDVEYSLNIINDEIIDKTAVFDDKWTT